MKRCIAILVVAFITGISFGVNASVQPKENQHISSIASSVPVLKSGEGHIELTVPCDEPVTFHIYSITGQLIKTITVVSGTSSVELRRGYYIVKCEKWSKQAVVR
ncbi:MAG: hypothetical protein IJY31_02620 [Muribaculaceae bacterium]|nr:hypothetical protein [Muribaculaceae bacterium]